MFSRRDRGLGCRASLALAFALACFGCGDDTPNGPSTGELQLVVTTAGGDVDPDGYLVSVDGDTPQRVTDGTITVGNLEPGSYEVIVTDIADNCELAGDNPLAVTVARDETTQATLAVTCAAYRGSLAVQVETTGWDVDGDGYKLLVDGVESAPLDPTASESVPVEPGEHSVALADVAPNCAVVIPRMRTVEVATLVEVSLAFRIYCAAASGPTAEQILLGGGSSGMLRVNADGTGAESLFFDPQVADYAAWSPDRNRVLVTLYDLPRDEFGGTLWTMAPDGSALDEVNAPAGVETSSWSPDGSQLVYRSRLPDVGLHVMNADGSNDVRITTGGEDWAPAWSPDGTRIIFSRVDELVNLYTVRPDGTELTPFPVAGISNVILTPRWSPDGTRIAFTAFRDGETGVWVVQDDGTGLERLTPLDLEVNPGEVAWSPTGDRLATTGGRGDDQGLWTVNSDGSDLTFRVGTLSNHVAWAK